MSNIVDLVKHPMSKRQVAALKRIDDEDYSLVVYKTRKDFLERGIVRDEEFYKDGITSLKQYYSTTIFDPYNMHAVSDDLDRFWHQHVIDTARYAMLCSDIKGFMHHDPLDRTDLAKVSAIAEVYQYTYLVLEKIYGSRSLSPIFFPAKPEMDILVCRHDVDSEMFGQSELEDVFPVDSNIAALRTRYGNEAKVGMIRACLNIKPQQGKSTRKKR